ncbi:MAG: molybdopterin-synthase adenylyltransferase MoeB [Chlorobi bacterium]|nr:molybdopterin-synthase adenylyltransferase MoeB [Chlorobiota bacterium]
MLSNQELKRYSRHIIMPEVGIKGQEKLKAAKVLVIGAGGLGCPVLQYLAAAGIGTIGILDFDKVSVSNLHRQILYADDDLGKPKAIVAKQKLSLLNPFVNFRMHNVKLVKANALEIIKEYDLVIDGSDNFSTRYLVSDACVILNKPLVFGAIYKFMGQVSVFNYKNGPTYRCLFPEQPEENDVPNCATIGVIGVIPGIIGSLQASEAIKVILGKGNVLSGRLFQIDVLNFSTDIIKFKRNDETANIAQLGEYDEFCNYDAEDVKNLSPGELKKMMDNNDEFVLYDVRDENVYHNYHIGGVLITMEKLLNQPESLPQNKPVIIMCEIGQKSIAIVEYLQKVKNFTNVFNLAGGIQAWISKGYNIITK